MQEIPIALREIHNFGRYGKEWVMSWHQEPRLAERGIESLGWVEPGEGYFFVSPHLRLTHLLACVDGWGEALADNRWQRCEAGQVYLAPLGQYHGYRTVGENPWKICWILGRDAHLIDARKPLIRYASGQALLCTIQGLYHEYHGRTRPSVIENWLDLLVLYAKQLGHADDFGSQRLNGLWDKVTADLAAPWTLDRLADEAALSTESVRRLSHQETGRSPMEQVTFLRMRSAATLLVTHSYRVSDVGERVGYSNPFSFSAVFKRVMGVSPDHYRKQANAERLLWNPASARTDDSGSPKPGE